MMDITFWFKNNFVEIFGAVTGIIYVFLEIRQNIWLWPLGILTSGVYILVFFTSKFYADMSLQCYYLVISILGWYWWLGGKKLGKGEGEKGGKGERNEEEMGRRGEGNEGEKGRKGERDESDGREGDLKISRLKIRTGLMLTVAFIILYALLWLVLTNLTDSPVPGWDSFITSLSIVATWMLARKIYEHWYLWIVVNFVSVVLFFVKGLYPTVALYFIYGIMSFAGLVEWRKELKKAEIKSA